MSQYTKIGWTDRTWNVVTGCSKVSAGCRSCYAEAVMERYKWHKFTDVTLHPERLNAPLHWRNPQRVFINSMSDMFHEEVSTEFIGKVFGIMSMCPQHVFQVLTKRAHGMKEILTSDVFREAFWKGANQAEELRRRRPLEQAMHYEQETTEWLPLPNVWLGVSVEDQEAADERIPILIQTPAAVRWVSAEPLLGRIGLRGITLPGPGNKHPIYDSLIGRVYHEEGSVEDDKLDWVVVGGESGPNFRPMDIEWLESIVDQCKATGVPVYVKQDSGRFPGRQGRIPDRLWIHEFPHAASPQKEE